MSDQYIVVVTSKEMGYTAGDSQIGEKLMTIFLNTLAKEEVLPTAILFYNSGVYYTLKDAETLEDVKALADKGVKVLTCGMCLDYFGLDKEVPVGEVGTMGQFVDLMRKSDRIVRP